MQDELISFETAKLAKEKGFDVGLEKYYTPEGNLMEHSGILFSNNQYHHNEISAPTQSLLQRWLREIHNIEAGVLRYTYSGGIYQGRKYMYYVDQYDPKYNHEIEEDDNHWILNERKSQEYEFNTYEQALESSLQEALKLI